MTYEEIIAKVAEETGLSKTLVHKTYSSYWKVIRKHITSLPLKEDLSDKEFLALRTNINIPSLGKFYITLPRYKAMKIKYNEKLKQSK